MASTRRVSDLEASMKAMVLRQLGSLADNSTPLELADLPVPVPHDGEILVRVAACGICHTELDEIEGRTPPPRLPVIPGHQVIGRVVELGRGVRGVQLGDRVGIPWIASACGICASCRAGLENLCPAFRATGRDVDGGYAEYLTVAAAFAHPIPDALGDVEAAPLLCAGAIGYRSLMLADLSDGENLGLTGFGASAHLVLQLARARYSRSPIFVFARSERARAFARELGASWAGAIEELAPEPLHRIIDTTPAWTPVVMALKNLAPGGRLVINAIRKAPADQEALLRLDYGAHLWMEKEIKSVANVTRRDVRELLALAASIPLKPEVEAFALDQANQALHDLANGRIRGAKVLRVG
jgi:propanol-preferring alcohol dehydrogenase